MFGEQILTEQYKISVLERKKRIRVFFARLLYGMGYMFIISAYIPFFLWIIWYGPSRSNSLFRLGVDLLPAIGFIWLTSAILITTSKQFFLDRFLIKKRPVLEIELIHSDLSHESTECIVIKNVWSLRLFPIFFQRFLNDFDGKITQWHSDNVQLHPDDNIFLISSKNPFWIRGVKSSVLFLLSSAGSIDDLLIKTRRYVEIEGLVGETEVYYTIGVVLGHWHNIPICIPTHTKESVLKCFRKREN